MQVSDASRLSSVELLNDNGWIYYDKKKYPEIPITSDDFYYRFNAFDRFDTISHKFYGTVKYNWIIALANNLYSEFDMSSGDLLRIPSLYSILEYITSLRK